MEAVAAAALHMHGRVMTCGSRSHCAHGKATPTPVKEGKEPECDSCELPPNCQSGIPAMPGVAVAARGVPVATAEELMAALLCCCWEKRELEDPEVGSGVAKLVKAPPR